MEEVDDAKRKRAAAKGWLTRADKYCCCILEKTEASLQELTDAIDEFERRLYILDETQSVVESVIDFSELESDIDSAADFRTERRVNYLKLKERVIETTKTSNSGTASECFGNSDPSSNNTRLPKLELPKFNGDYTSWQTFWEKFEACVDKSSIPDVNKFSYLQSVLGGEAALSIRGLALTSENYATAKEILKKRFGRPQRIIFGHIQNLLKMNNRSSDGSAQSLWKIHDEIQINVRSLRNLGVGGDTYGVILTPLILHQLPPNIRLEWARVGEDREGDLEFLLKFLHEEIARRERSQAFNSFSNQSKHFEPTKNPRPTAAALFSCGGSEFPKENVSKKQSSRKFCAFCPGEHFSDQCPVIKNLTFDQRKAKIKELGLCFRCIGKGHLSMNCSKVCYFCKGSHHSVLCKGRLAKNADSDSNETTPPPTGAQEGQPTHQGVSYSNSGKRTTLMQVIKTKVNGVEVSLLFDSGSDRSFVNASTAQLLKLKPIGCEELSYSCFGEQNAGKRKQKPMTLYELEHNGIKMKLLEIPDICSPMHRSAVPLEALATFEDIVFTECYETGRSVKIDILIGLDCYWDIVGTNVKTNGGLVAQETRFGWMLSGYWESSLQRNLENGVSIAMHCQTAETGIISEDLIRRMWDLDSVGVADVDLNEDSAGDKSDKVTSEFRNNVRLSQGRYEVQLPWKSEDHKKTLVDNKEQALKRLENLTKKMSKNQDLRDRYDAVLTDLENEGIIHEIPETEMNTENPVFYLPHRPVIKEESLSTKVRPVFDASAKAVNGVSLNDCLDTGPNLLPDLVEVLVRFRKHKFGIVADIKKAFLQIKLNKADQDVHRFVWDVNGMTRHMRFERVTFGVNCSPFLLNATIKYHLDQFEDSKIIRELRQNLYMDDLLTGADSEEEVLQMVTDADEVMTKGGFTLTKWGTNCSCLPQSIVKEINCDLTETAQTRKILGIVWNVSEDCFSFETLRFELCQSIISKRMLLSMIARIFDPLGLLTPFSITLKICFQDAWKIGIEWDEDLPSKIQKEVSKWIEGLENIRTWKIPRRLTTNEIWTDNGQIELIAFSDASEKAYGCCIYLKKTHDETGEMTANLIMSRARVSPLKRITLPRLELMAAVLAARLVKFVMSALQLNQECPYTCYSDSQIALHWLKGESTRWKQFVGNRVEEIQNLTDVAVWKHCRSKDNPADLLTRGLDAETLSNSKFWLNGPQWLIEPTEPCGAVTESDCVDNDEIDKLAEIEKSKSTVAFVVENSNSSTDNIFTECERSGKWEKLLRVCGWVLRFINNCRSRKQKKDKDLTKHLSSEEIATANRKIIWNLQRTSYEKELNDLQGGGVVDKKSPISNLAPFVGRDGLLRVKGRLDFAPGMYYDERHPIILPKCHTTYLIVQAHHEAMKHAGVNTLIAALRTKFWIVGARTLAKRICKGCVRCQRQNSRPLDQVTAPLPEDRLTKSPPFHVTGVDHAGPLFCKNMENKLYILIFTCAVTRAVHLELVESLSLDDFLMAFRRFTARRGLPTIMYSDNAKTFKGADQYIQRNFTQANIVWKFNAPKAPWWGGWWERLIRSVKTGLRKSLGVDRVSRIELETTLHEVESCINSRPLTYVEETKQPLTPSHFLIGRGTPFMSVEPIEFSHELMNLCQREIDLRKAIDRFWEIWRDDYIRYLPSHKLKKPSVDLKVGSLVLIKNEGRSRLTWPLGLVTETYTGKDGFVRAVRLKTANGFIDRPVQVLHKLEIESGEDEQDVDKEVSTSTRPKRVVKPRRILDL